MKRILAIGLPAVLLIMLALAGCGNETQYTLNITIENGPDCTVNPLSGTTYPTGTVVTLTAVSAPGYALDHWGGPDGASVTTENTILMNANKSIAAVFAKLQYDLTIEAYPAAGGTVETEIVTQSRSVLGVEHGQTVRLTAKPNAGYVFDHWEGALTGAENPVTLTLTEQPTQAVIACFVPTLQGHVFGLNTHHGMAGITITVGVESTSTDINGYWQVKGVSFPVSVAALHPTAPGYFGLFIAPESVDITAATPTDIDFAMSAFVFERFWGSNGTGDGEFKYPGCMAADTAGRIYVADSQNCRIQQFDFAGTYVAQWGSSGDGNGQFINPRGIAADASGNIYVADNGNHRVQKFSSDGTYLGQWGSYGEGDGQFIYPVGVAVSGNYVFVSDSGNHRIQKFGLDGTYQAQWGSWGSENGLFSSPGPMAADATGHIYVADCDNQRIQKFRLDGTYLSQWGSYGDGNGQFYKPGGIAVDGAGYVYVTDYNLNRLQIFNSEGTYMTGWGTLGTEIGQFNRPSGIAVDATGNLYVLETYNHRVQKFQGL